MTIGDTFPNHDAFPTAETSGFTKREEFAKSAMTGLLANPGFARTPAEQIGIWATNYADALIEALNKPKITITRDELPKSGYAGYAGYSISEESLERLKLLFPPKFEKFIGSHVTSAYNVTEAAKPSCAPDHAYVVGYECDEGIECLIVEIDGSCNRPDGHTFHITWSLNPNLNVPVDAKILANNSIWRTPEEVGRVDRKIELTPAFFPFR